MATSQHIDTEDIATGTYGARGISEEPHLHGLKAEPLVVSLPLPLGEVWKNRGAISALRTPFLLMLIYHFCLAFLRFCTSIDRFVFTMLVLSTLSSPRAPGGRCLLPYDFGILVLSSISQHSHFPRLFLLPFYPTFVLPHPSPLLP